MTQTWRALRQHGGPAFLVALCAIGVMVVLRFVWVERLGLGLRPLQTALLPLFPVERLVLAVPMSYAAARLSDRVLRANGHDVPRAPHVSLRLVAIWMVFGLARRIGHELAFIPGVLVTSLLCMSVPTSLAGGHGLASSLATTVRLGRSHRMPLFVTALVLSAPLLLAEATLPIRIAGTSAIEFLTWQFFPSWFRELMTARAVISMLTPLFEVPLMALGAIAFSRTR